MVGHLLKGFTKLLQLCRNISIKDHYSRKLLNILHEVGGLLLSFKMVYMRLFLVIDVVAGALTNAECPSLPLLPGPLRPRVVAPDEVVSIGKKNYLTFKKYDILN